MPRYLAYGGVSSPGCATFRPSKPAESARFVRRIRLSGLTNRAKMRRNPPGSSPALRLHTTSLRAINDRLPVPLPLLPPRERKTAHRTNLLRQISFPGAAHRREFTGLARSMRTSRGWMRGRSRLASGGSRPGNFFAGKGAAIVSGGGPRYVSQSIDINTQASDAPVSGAREMLP